MKTTRSFLLLLASLALASLLRAADGPVTLREEEACFVLNNGLVEARVAKASGDLVSFRYRGREMLAVFLGPDGLPDLQRDPPGATASGLNRGMTDHQYGFWSHDAMGPRGTGDALARVTIDPAGNGGERAEVSVKGVSKGRKMGTGPGAPQTGQFASDIEIRYALSQGDPGVYTYCIFEHPADYPATAIGEARFCAKLAGFFDWLSVSSVRNQSYPKGLHEGDKYVYTVVQSENPAFGWSSTTEKLGFFILNPSQEYMSGGPTKVEFEGHRDTNAVSAPCVLNYWRSSHYGGAEVAVADGEHWTKVVGPFMLYANAGATPQAMYDDAKARQKKEAAAWPYDWVTSAPYPHSSERATVSGRLVLADPQAAGFSGFAHLSVGLVYPDYPSARPAAPGASSSDRPLVTWQTDAKHYQFWTKGASDGSFEIPKVRPGTYELRAFTDGVLGEYARAQVTVESGKNLDLGKLTWTPVRRGRQVWEIGVPNRNGSEFAGGSEFSDPEISLKYALRFPNDVRYVVGAGDPAKDWFYQQVPHNEDPNAKALPFYGVRGNGRATPFTVVFDMPSAPRGKAVLRVALCGTGTKTLSIVVNNKPAGELILGPGDGVITRHGHQGLWNEREFSFDASQLHAGANTLAIVVPVGPVNNGIVYDYLRLELDETASQ